MRIPKLLHTTWVGPKDPPMVWINTWKELNPEYEHTLWDNEMVFGRSWRLQRHIDFFRERSMWHGVADCVRYEVLYELGGFNPGADSVCLASIDELFKYDEFDAYTCYENEKVRGKLTSPLLACTAGNDFAKLLIDVLEKKEVVGEPWMTTGNLFMQHMIEAVEYPRLKIWPSHFLLPEHYTGEKYDGPDLPYATHMWGTTTGSYNKNI